MIFFCLFLLVHASSYWWVGSSFGECDFVSLGDYSLFSSLVVVIVLVVVDDFLFQQTLKKGGGISGRGGFGSLLGGLFARGLGGGRRFHGCRCRCILVAARSRSIDHLHGLTQFRQPRLVARRVVLVLGCCCSSIIIDQHCFTILVGQNLPEGLLGGIPLAGILGIAQQDGIEQIFLIGVGAMDNDG